MKELTPQETFQAILDGKKVEYRHPHLDWTILKPTRLKLSKLLAPDYQYRLAQEMVTIGDVSFPKPVSEPLKLGTKYWLAKPDYKPYTVASPFIWANDVLDKAQLKRGLVHLSIENAIAHARALVQLSGGNPDDVD